MDVDGDERLVLRPLGPAQLLGRPVDQLVEEVQELLIGRLHDLSANQIVAVRGGAVKDAAVVQM